MQIIHFKIEYVYNSGIQEHLFADVYASDIESALEKFRKAMSMTTPYTILNIFTVESL